jgi:hypothetical protein
MTRQRALIATGCLAVALAACPDAGAQVRADLKVILLESDVQFENITGRAGANTIESDRSLFATRLVAAARSEIEARVLELMPEGSCVELLGSDDCARLIQLSSRLARGHVNQEARDILTRMSPASGELALLLQFMRVKAGPGGSWNPFSGAITSSMSSTLLQSALISTTSADVLWNAEVFVRKTFGPKSGDFKASLALLYRTLTVK